MRAEQYLSAAIAGGYDRGVVLPFLLDACLSSSRLRAGLTHAEPYLRSHPEDDSLRYLVAIIHMGLGQLDAARSQLDALLRRNERNGEAHFLLGVLDSPVDAVSAREHLLAYLDVTPRGERAAEARSRLAELAVRDVPSHPRVARARLSASVDFADRSREARSSPSSAKKLRRSHVASTAENSGRSELGGERGEP